jgi:hypothetical protein
MTCEEARECFPLFLEGNIRLTELAAVEVHISQCAACRGELDRLQDEKPRARASRALNGEASEPAAVPDVSRRRRLLLFTGMAGVATIVILTALGVHVYQQNLERERIVIEAMTSARGRDEREPREPTLTESPVPPPAQVQPRAIPPVAPPLRPGVAGRSADLPRTRAVPIPSPPPVSRRDGSPAAPSREVAPASPAPRPDVVVQLSVKDRGAAERDLSMLLARVGATQVRRQPDFTFVAVVPQSRYGEFTRGMAQIGSWQMETDRSTVPDPVHVAVRLVSLGSRRSGPGA